MNQHDMPIDREKGSAGSLFRRSVYALTASIAGATAAFVLLMSVAAAASDTSSAQHAADVGWRGIMSQDDDDHDDGDTEIHGFLVNAVTSFEGEWLLEVNADQTITVLLSAGTDVRRFEGQLPQPGDWLEAKGALDTGVLDAVRVRPDDVEANQVVVRLKPTANPIAVAQQLAATYDMTVTAVLSSASIFLYTTTDDEDVEAGLLMNDNRVRWAEVNWVSRVPIGNPYRTWKWGEADVTGYANQAAFDQINLGPAQQRYTGAGATIAILDTGIDLQHPTFQNSVTVLANSDMVSDTSAPDDVGPGLAWGHGTHVAGIIRRIAPDAQLMPVRILDSQGRGNTFVLAYAIEYATANGADIINLSLGAECGSKVLSEAIASAIDEGVVIVAAAGNEGVGTPQCPASMPGVLAVAAVNDQKQKTDWSNYGADWVDLAAPGQGITSTFPLGYRAEVDAALSSGYAAWSGTSMAAPFVTGAAALVTQMTRAENLATPVAVRLRETSDDISQINQYAIGGHLNAAVAVGADPAEPTPTPDPTPDPGDLPNNVFLPVMTTK